MRSGLFLLTTFLNVVFVLALPDEDPVISGIEMEYRIGDEINLNCTSGKSHPVSTLNWYINEQQVSTLNRKSIDFRPQQFSDFV